MDRQTISHYGWVIVVTLILAVILALATPFGDFVGGTFISISRNYRDVGVNKLNDIEKTKDEFEEFFMGDRLPEGFTYHSASGRTYEANGAIPTPKYGDIYISDDGKIEYRFGFNYVCVDDTNASSPIYGWRQPDTPVEEWGCKISKTSPKTTSDIGNNLFGYPVTAVKEPANAVPES